MAPAPAPDPTISKRALDSIQVLATVAGSLTVVWGFMKVAGTPFFEWRKRRQTEIVRTVLKEQLDRLDAVCDREEEILREYSRIVQRQEAIFRDLDVLLDIAQDNRDRLDEINELLDSVGLASRDRRHISEDDIAAAMEGLIERRRKRRRGDGEGEVS